MNCRVLKLVTSCLYGLLLTTHVSCTASYTPPFSFGACQDQGNRYYMEDFYTIEEHILSAHRAPILYAAVFDGHSGTEAAHYAKKKLFSNYLKLKDEFGIFSTKEALTAAFKKTDQEFLEHPYTSGTTVVAAVVEDDTLYLANLGDSRAIVVRNGHVVDETIDHKPAQLNEKKRIEAAGGQIVTYFGIDRIFGPRGAIAVSRSLGDKDYKYPYCNFGGHYAYTADLISAEPDITRCGYTTFIDFVLLASDGVWDVFSSKEVAAMIDYLLKNIYRSGSEHARPNAAQIAAQFLVNQVIQSNNLHHRESDNITVLILLNDNRYKFGGYYE